MKNRLPPPPSYASINMSVPYQQLGIIDDDDNNDINIFNPELSDDESLVSVGDPLEASGISLLRKSTELDLNNVDTLLEDLPQGRHYGVYSCVIFIVSRIFGSGIFSTPGGIFRNCGGSPFLFFLAWVIATIVSFLCMIVYLELGTLMPRSGGPKFFLEMIYNRPKYLSVTVISLQAVIFGFTCSNAIIFGQYIMSALGYDVNIDKSIVSRLVGLGLIAVCAVVQSISVKTTLYVQNVVGLIKLALLGILALTGFYVLFIPTSLENHLHWNDFLTPSQPVTVSSFTGAVLQAIFSFNGWESIYLISSEIKNPVRTLKIVGPLSLIVTFLTYLFINIAYLKVIPHKEIFGSGQLIGSLLFEKVFGQKLGKQFLAVTVAFSTAGNVYVVLYGISRMSQEVFRDGILPGLKFMSSNWPGYGTPVPALFLSLFVSGCILVLPPPGDVFSYIVSLEVYIFQMLMLAIVLGLFRLRRRYPDIKRPIRAPTIAPIVAAIFISYLIITPLTKNSLPIAHLPNYPVLALILVCSYVLFWYFKFRLLPKVFGYKLQRELVVLDDGLVVKTWTKV